MDGIFTLPYSEYRVAETLVKLFPKKEGFALFVPTSRQEKGIDLLLFNRAKGKTVTIQVKSSRAYQHDSTKSKNKYGIWLNNFITQCEKGEADFYIIYGLYPVYNEKNINAKECWKEILLCYSQKEMLATLNRVRLAKTPEEKDRFFGYEFDSDKKVFSGRGFGPEREDVSRYLLQAKIPAIKKALGLKE